MMYEFFTAAALPYLGIRNADVVKAVLKNEVLPPPLACPDEMYVLMMFCWQPDPNQRISFRKLCSSIAAQSMTATHLSARPPQFKEVTASHTERGNVVLDYFTDKDAQLRRSSFAKDCITDHIGPSMSHSTGFNWGKWVSPYIPQQTSHETEEDHARGRGGRGGRGGSGGSGGKAANSSAAEEPYLFPEGKGIVGSDEESDYVHTYDFTATDVNMNVYTDFDFGALATAHGIHTKKGDVVAGAPGDSDPQYLTPGMQAF